MRQRKQKKSRQMGSRVVEQLERRMLLSSSLDAGVLNIIGTAGRDIVGITSSSGTLTLTDNGVQTQYSVAAVSKIYVDLQAYSDQFTMQSDIAIPTEVYGDAGADTISTGAGADTVYGGKGNDLIQTYGGRDLVWGGAGADRINTGARVDTINGGDGNDTINSGAGFDSVDGGTGINSIDSPDALIVRPPGTTIYESDTFIATVSGYDPNQIRLAYNYGNYDPNAGAGQTIYIVDAFTGRNVQSDFNTFCTQFDLPAQTIQIVNASGFTPAVDPGWAGEINLDLQWAHAAAPGAKLVLVQADSAFASDMIAAIGTAANMSEAAGGGIVSMSFGFGNIILPAAETIFNNSSHTTFLASSGDVGGQLNYPSTSPNVTSVGGTDLFVNQDGTRDSEETAWAEGGGGVTAAFQTPSYQLELGLAGRGTPDVAYNAGVGVATYITTPQSGNSGWFSAMGTSAGAPQWAGIVARMNQARINAGKHVIGTGLNGLVYQLYNDGNAYFDPSAQPGVITGGFTDIIAGSAGTNAAGIGYDLATGIGVPNVSTLVQQAVQTNSFYISGQFGFDAQFSLPHDTTIPANTIPTFPVVSPQPVDGTGMLSGGDVVDLSFSVQPNHWLDPTGVSANDIISASLFRTTGGRIYGTGTAFIRNSNDVGPFAVTFVLHFEGTWTTQADGSTTYAIDFYAIDPTTGAAINTSTWARSVTDPLYSGCWFGGSLNGTA